MSKKNQSSIEWLIEKIDFDANARCYSQQEWYSIFQQAKAMHKAEIVKSSAQGYLMGVGEGFPLETAHNYAHKWYNNQFKGGKDE